MDLVLLLMGGGREGSGGKARGKSQREAGPSPCLCLEERRKHGECHGATRALYDRKAPLSASASESHASTASTSDVRPPPSNGRAAEHARPSHMSGASPTATPRHRPYAPACRHRRRAAPNRLARTAGTCVAPRWTRPCWRARAARRSPAVPMAAKRAQRGRWFPPPCRGGAGATNKDPLDSASPKKKTALQLYLFTWRNFQKMCLSFNPCIRVVRMQSDTPPCWNWPPHTGLWTRAPATALPTRRRGSRQ